MPVTRNPVYLAAQQSGCHASCPIPMAVLKAAEVAMEMALPRDVSIRFEGRALAGTVRFVALDGRGFQLLGYGAAERWEQHRREVKRALSFLIAVDPFDPADAYAAPPFYARPARVDDDGLGPTDGRLVALNFSDKDIDRVREVLLEVSDTVDMTLDQPTPRVRFRSFGTSALDFELLAWIREPELRGRTLDALHREVYKRFAAEGIEIAFPQQDLHVRSMPDV